MMAGLDAYNQQAFGILTSSKLMEALDLKNEDPKVIEAYGKGDPKNRDDGGPKLMEHFLIARDWSRRGPLRDGRLQPLGSSRR